MLEHIIKVVGLHDHVVELKEGEPFFHTLLIALGAQHIVDAEAGAHLAQQIDIVELQEPIGIIEHDRLVLAKLDKALHLALEAFGIVGDILSGEHLSHIGATGGVTNHSGAATNESNGVISRHLQAFH